MRNKTFLGHPIGFWYVFLGEFAERAAYYGMRSIIALFLVDVMGFDKGQSGLVALSFAGSCYAMCLLGGWLSDKYFGKFWTIIIFAIPYIAGYPLLTFAHQGSGFILYVSLFLLALGSGVIKPNITPLMASMYDDKPDALKKQAFSWLYGSINLGSGLTSVLIPLVRTHYGYSAAFLSTTVVMIVALTIFFFGKKYYPKNEVSFTSNSKKDDVYYDYRTRIENRKKIFRVLSIFFVIIFFFAMYDQSMATWVFFSQDHMILYGFTADQFQALNPWLIVVLTLIFPFIWKFFKIEKATSKMKVGFILTALCMGIMAFAGYLSVDHKVTSLWIMGAYFVMAFAELCIVVVGLEFAYDEAGPHMKSKMTSFFFVSVFIGDQIAGQLSEIYPKMQPVNYFSMMTAIMLGVLTLFFIVARNFERNREVKIPDIALDVAES